MKISIITSCFNREATIGQAIESVLSQDYPDIEYIVVDGASKDRSLEVINRYKDRISKIISEPDKGMYEGINKGIKAATGDIIGLLHSDDFLYAKDTISRMAQEFERTGADFVYGNGLFVDPDNTDKVIRNWMGGSYSKWKVLRSTICFGILSGVVLELGRFMDAWSYFYLTFLGLLFISLSVFRILMRWGLKRYRSKGGNLRYVVLVGSSGNNRELYYELTTQDWTGFRVKGYFDFEPNPKFPQECPYLGKPQDVKEYLEKNGNTHYLFCCLPSKEHVIIRSLIDYCENHLVHFYSVPNIYNYLQNRVYFNMIGNVPFLSLRPEPLSRTGNKMLKRAFDIVFSLLFLCTLFPIILLIVTIITKLTMPGPVFFKQKRNGLNDKEFYCYKFRSMRVNTQADSLQATKDDPRKTRWGNIMRKTSIDELPQFINVLLGDMSVVGPRPHMLKHTEEYSKLINKYMVRHFVKPGMHIPADTRSAFPVISVQSPVSIQCCWQS